ncbi:hypothetical protein LWI29_003540 [Acer saccharum]|uniref:Leucine-rich repeat-containing N-terminal plant-type domain-containing protein n=1 Tax=Acer saccharum TaxID=4024 RepID=A0AA39RGD8_ACESA|nr:hypothetical protein LWI29_003540 [Acer saccharum]
MERLSVFGLLLAILCAITSKYGSYGDTKFSNCSKNDLEALINFQNGLEDPENRLSSWKGSNCCQWRGIDCDNSTGAVVSIDLRNPFPVNSDSSSSTNPLNSELPDWLVNISTLVHFDLSNCNLFGRIPLGFGELPNLQYFSLAGNDNLSASCSQLFRGSWKMIRYINLASNRLHGKLPSSIGNMSFLTNFDLSMNNVGGGIPSSIGKLCKLKEFDLFGNNLTGSLPEFLEGTDNCVSNSPLPNLMYLRLSNNHLQGKLPDWLGQLGNLVELDLSYNQFQGPIPASLGNLQNLTIMSLEGNEINGTLPESFGNLSELSTLDVSVNHLTAGILFPMLMLAIRKPWSNAYFNFLDRIVDKLLWVKNKRS